jgi:hypothetical protein
MTSQAGSGVGRLCRRGVSRKNQALRRWLVRFTAERDDRGEQWWDHFDTMLQRNRVHLHPLDP